jgi:hypothetical protein
MQRAKRRASRRQINRHEVTLSFLKPEAPQMKSGAASGSSKFRS